MTHIQLLLENTLKFPLFFTLPCETETSKHIEKASTSTNELLKIEKLFSNSIGACVNTGYIKGLVSSQM